ncbi:MAG: MerR family transcriptional regulator [Anaerolineae bacterium]|jgi:DNA-binding transcriptional MerR regulator|nr:MerR family transcriptional regulator [Anaerolineae bacterium]
MFRIKDLARQAGVNAPAIRYYEEIGVLPAPNRADNGYRVYSERDLERLRFVTRARSLDFTLEAIGEILTFRERGEAPCVYVIGQITAKIAEVDHKITELNRLKEELLQLQQQAEQLPLAEIEARSCVCHLIENQEIR